MNNKWLPKKEEKINSNWEFSSTICSTSSYSYITIPSSYCVNLFESKECEETKNKIIELENKIKLLENKVKSLEPKKNANILPY